MMQTCIGIRVVIYNKLMLYYMKHVVRDIMVNLLYSTTVQREKVFTVVSRAALSVIF